MNHKKLKKEDNVLLISKAWQIGKDFFLDQEQRFQAWSLLVVSIILQLALVYGYVVLNKWNNDFYNALQEFDKDALYIMIQDFCIVVFFLIFVFVTKYVCQAKLALNWRKYMTIKYCQNWLNNNAFYGYHILNHKNDNPDQKISEDLSSFTSISLELAFGLLDSVVTLASFITILWSLSGVLKFTLFNINISIYGYLVWAALIYAIVGTIITYKIGKKLAYIDFLQEQKEANLRFAMMRVRENSESIALYNGQHYEENVFKAALEEIIKNTLSFIKINKNLSIWTNIYNNFSNIAPILIACPMYFSKKILLGGLMQIANAFNKVQDALSFLVSSFKLISSYKAVIERLIGFNSHIEEWNRISSLKSIQIVNEKIDDLVIEHLTLKTPNDKTLLEDLNYSFSASKAYLITGKNGSGKSTLIKAIAGMWFYGSGKIILPQNKSVFFIPQNSYMNFGTLAEIIMYPSCAKEEESKLTKLLECLNIKYLSDRLNLEENWSTALSLGEQQKLAILRAIMHKPSILILDEATSSLTEEDEAIAYDLLKRTLPNSIIISVGHRSTLNKMHDYTIHIGL